MDGSDPSAGVIIMAATNRPEVLDPALLRRGRFDRQIAVDRPDRRGRAAIVAVQARKGALDPSVNLDLVAARTPGFAGAELANVINEAALLAARRNRPTVTMAELEEAVDRVSMGLERRSRVITPTERRRIAYHGLGHALAALRCPNADPVHRVSIVPRGIAALGVTQQLPSEDRYLLTEPELEDRLSVMMGGRAAERLVFGNVSSGAQNDIEQATALARRMVEQFGMSRRWGRSPSQPRRHSWTATGGRSCAHRRSSPALSARRRRSCAPLMSARTRCYPSTAGSSMRWPTSCSSVRRSRDPSFDGCWASRKHPPQSHRPKRSEAARGRRPRAAPSRRRKHVGWSPGAPTVDRGGRASGGTPDPEPRSSRAPRLRRSRRVRALARRRGARSLRAAGRGIERDDGRVVAVVVGDDWEEAPPSARRDRTRRSRQSPRRWAARG